MGEECEIFRALFICFDNTLSLLKNSFANKERIFSTQFQINLSLSFLQISLYMWLKRTANEIIHRLIFPSFSAVKSTMKNKIDFTTSHDLLGTLEKCRWMQKALDILMILHWHEPHKSKFLHTTRALRASSKDASFLFRCLLLWSKWK